MGSLVGERCLCGGCVGGWVGGVEMMVVVVVDTWTVDTWSVGLCI
jgi:hypothetical protein